MIAPGISTTAAPLCLLRLPDVIARVGLRRTAVYDLIARGKFPRPIRLGRRCSAWPSDVIDRWVKERIAEAGRCDLTVRIDRGAMQAAGARGGAQL